MQTVKSQYKMSVVPKMFLTGFVIVLWHHIQFSWVSCILQSDFGMGCWRSESIAVTCIKEEKTLGCSVGHWGHTHRPAGWGAHKCVLDRHVSHSWILNYSASNFGSFPVSSAFFVCADNKCCPEGLWKHVSSLNALLSTRSSSPEAECIKVWWIQCLKGIVSKRQY